MSEDNFNALAASFSGNVLIVAAYTLSILSDVNVVTRPSTVLIAINATYRSSKFVGNPSESSAD